LTRNRPYANYNKVFKIIINNNNVDHEKNYTTRKTKNLKSKQRFFIGRNQKEIISSIVIIHTGKRTSRKWEKKGVPNTGKMTLNKHLPMAVGLSKLSGW
jgi:hypothetical protein